MAGLPVDAGVNPLASQVLAKRISLGARDADVIEKRRHTLKIGFWRPHAGNMAQLIVVIPARRAPGFRNGFHFT